MKFLSLLCLSGILSLFSAQAEIKLSKRLTEIAGHLGDGGVHFSLTDSKGDLQQLGLVLDQILTAVPDVDLPPGLKMETLFGDLGLYSVVGRGSSVHELEEAWHHRSFVLTDGNHKGVLSLLGDEAQAPAALDFAPAGADLVLETSLDLREVERTMSQIAKTFGREAERELAGGLKQEVTSLGLSLADIFVDFTVRGSLVFWLDEEKTFELNPETRLPVPHLAVRLENAGTIWKLLESELGEVSELVEKDGEMIMTSKEGQEETPFGTIVPRFVWSPETKELFFSFTEADLAACRAQGARLRDDAHFKAAYAGLPEKGNGLVYGSKDLFALSLELAKQFAPGVPPEGQGVVEALMPFLEKVASGNGYALAYAVEENGFLFAANLPIPLKEGGVMSGMGGIATVGMISGIATPLILRAQEAGEEAETLGALKAYAGAQLSYRQDHGRYAGASADLIKAELLDEGLVEILEKASFEMVVPSDYEINESSDILAMALSAKDDRRILIARVDGSANILLLEKAMEQLAKQKTK